MSAIQDYSLSERQTAISLLREAKRLLVEKHQPFPILTAIEHAGLPTFGRIWRLIDEARRGIEGPKDEHHLEATIARLEAPL